MTQCVCARTHSSNFGAVTLSKTFLDHSSICICSRYFFLNMVLIIPLPATKPCQADRSSCLKPSTFTVPSSWNTLPLHDSLLLLPEAVLKHHLPNEANPPLTTHYYTATFLWPVVPIPLSCFTFPWELLTFHSLVHLSACAYNHYISLFNRM